MMDSAAAWTASIPPPSPSDGAPAMSRPRFSDKAWRSCGPIRPAAHRRGQFAVAVAGEGVGPNAERLQHAPGPEAHGAERRLGRVGGAQGVLVGGPLLRSEGA